VIVLTPGGARDHSCRCRWILGAKGAARQVLWSPSPISINDGRRLPAGLPLGKVDLEGHALRVISNLSVPRVRATVSATK